MSHKPVAKPVPRNYIISLYEIIILVIVFIGMLIFLYPKDNLHKLVLQEKSNYDLSAIYLQNLIRIDPENSTLVLTMANTLYEQHKYNLAKNLLEVLNQDTHPDIRMKSTLMHLKINQTLLKDMEDDTQKQAYIQKNKTLLKSIEDDVFDTLEDKITLYNTALSLQDKKTALHFNLQIIPEVKNQARIQWLKNLHYLADALHNTKYNKLALTFLVKEDKEETQTWLNALMPLLDTKEELDAISQSIGLKGEPLAKLYIQNGQYTQAAEQYMRLYHDSPNYHDKKSYFLSMIKLYRMNNQSKKAADIAKDYEETFLHDSQITKVLLKLYLEANHPDYAQKLSLKLMNTKDIK